MRFHDGTIRLTASDLSNFLACRHLTRLDMLKSQDRLRPSAEFDAGFQKLIQRGEDHEQHVLEGFCESGWSVAEISTDASMSDAEKARATREALDSGVDVVYQGVLLVDTGETALFGRPDFLVRAERLTSETDGDDHSPGYEIVDAKLARSAKARAVLQCVFYSHLLAQLQGTSPRRLHLVLGNGEFASFRLTDFAAYERRIRSYLEDFVGEEAGEYPAVEPYPEPVEHCAICRWRATCAKKRREDDDLSLVAGMPTTQRIALKEVGVHGRRQFAELAALPEIKRATADSLLRSQLQARLQVESEDKREIRYQLLDPDRDEEGELVPNRGLLALPEPSEGDLFFDIEGARYYSEDDKEFGLQYLFGMVDTADRDADGRPRYTQIWSFDRNGEKRAFEELIDFITARRAVHASLHVYHYNHYEPTSLDHLSELHETREEAVGRLMGRFATHEDEVDDFFRLGVFVDLYRVVRQGLRAGVESYSIKRLEELIGFERAVDLEDATEHLIAFESALDDGMAAEEVETRHVVAGYNEDDCRATLALRDWLESRRPELEAMVGEESLPRPVAQAETDSKVDADVVRLKELLVAGVQDDPADQSREEVARVLLADLLEWHRREAKPAWWRYFRLRTLSSDELIDEPDAIGGLTGGEIVGKVKRSIVRRFEFPPQEHGFDAGDAAEDPVSGKTWTVIEVDEEEGTIDLKIGKVDAPLPTAIVEGGPVNTKTLEARLRDLAEHVAHSGFSPPTAATALLLRLGPGGDDAEDAPLRHEDEGAADAAQRLIIGLRDSYLAIQGPPGSGKTFTAAGAILALVAEGRTVGVTAPSHAVICNVLNKVVEQAALQGRTVRIGQKSDADERFLHPAAGESLDYEQLKGRVEKGELDIVAGTAWLWAREEFAQSVDVLVVDEAGQFSLANVLSISGSASNLVLLGDPQQLAQPSQGAHPLGAEVSALGYVLGEQDTMPDNAGIFLDRTYRMHPDLCRYTSEVFYDDRLEGVVGLQNQRIDGSWWTLPATGLSFVEVTHEGNANASPEEASEVVRLVQELIGGAIWTDRFEFDRPVAHADVLIVTPFNAQVREIDSALTRAGISGVRVGTVDKFQGQESPVAVYSMASSSSADAPRGLEFLFDPHRLNVATSRARAVAVLVASPDLLRVFCKTPRQMVLANALCRASEM